MVRTLNKPWNRIDWSPEKWIFYLFCGALFVLPMGTSPFTILGCLGLAVWFFCGEFLKKRNVFFKEPWLLPVLVMAALAWIGLLYSPDPFGLGLKYAGKSHYWLYALAVSGVALSPRMQGVLIRAFLAGLFINALIGFMQMADLVPTLYKERYSGLSAGYNTLSILLILGILMGSFYFRWAKHRKGRFGYLLLILVYFIQLIILRGRGGYLAFALLSPLVVYNLAGGKNLLITFLLYLLAIDLMSFSPFVQERVIESIEDVKVQFRSGGDVSWGKKYSEDEKLQRIDRIYMWRWALDLLKAHPLTGVGTGGYKQAILAGGGRKGIAHPHNNFLYMGASFGAVGILALAWFFWVLLRNGWKHRSVPLGFFVLSSGLVIFVGGLTDTQILDAGPAFLLGITTGLQAALPKGAGAGVQGN